MIIGYSVYVTLGDRVATKRQDIRVSHIKVFDKSILAFLSSILF